MRYAQVRSERKRRRSNRAKYRAYLRDTEDRLAHDAELQREYTDRLYPDHERLWGMVMRRRHLWERRADDPDFLRVRLGRGAVANARPLRLEISDDPLTERETDLEDEASLVVRRWREVNDVPVVLDLAPARIVSVVGEAEDARALARALVAQLAAFRAPADLRILAAYDARRRGRGVALAQMAPARAGGGPLAPGRARAGSAAGADGRLDGAPRAAARG